jgi:putative membrane protein
MHIRGDRRRLIFPVVLGAYTLYFGYLLISGRLEDLVSPRMTIFVALGVAALAVLLAAQVYRLRTRTGAPHFRNGVLLFFVPLVLVPLTIRTNSALMVSSGGISLEQGGPHIDLTTKLHAAVNPFLPQPKPEPISPKGPIAEAGPIVLTKDNYYAVYNELYANPQAFSGRTIRASGFVFGDKSAPDSFIMARELMWCCAADAVGIGFVTRLGGPLPKSATWVAVSGRLATTPYVDRYTRVHSIVPMIEVTSIRTLEEPDFVYVYPR